jgi:hypothetical protein
MVMAKPSCTKTRGPTRGSGPATGLSFSASRFANFNFRCQPRLIRLPAEPARPGSHGCQSLWGRDPRNDIAWHQADDKAVGVVEDDRGVDRQVERRGGRPRCSHRTLRYRCLHLRVPSSTRDPHGCITLHRRRRSAVSVTSWPPLGSPRSSCAHRWPPSWAGQSPVLHCC